jgi:hypothetical protein
VGQRVLRRQVSGNHPIHRNHADGPNRRSEQSTDEQQAESGLDLVGSHADPSGDEFKDAGAEQSGEAAGGEIEGRQGGLANEDGWHNLADA